MSAADEAYRAAEAAIAEAGRTGADTLYFDSDTFRALDRLPPGLAALESLKTLDLANTQITDLVPLSGLTGLQWLTLDRTQVSDLAPVAGLTGLTTLSFQNTGVSDLSPLVGLAGLFKLYCNLTLVKDITPLSGLGRLDGVWLDNTEVEDIAALTVLERLTYLSINTTQVRELSPLAGLRALKVLVFQNTGVKNVDPLAKLTSLEVLSFNGTLVSDLTPLAELTGLKALLFNNTRVLDLRPLRGLRKLADDPEDGGLTFQGIPATSDPRVAGLAVIEDPRERATALFALLDAGWVPPRAVEPVALEPDPLLRSILIDGRLEIETDPPTEAERQDRMKGILHGRLSNKAGALAALAGNRFPRLANRARALATLLDRPFDDLDLLSVHLEIEDLEDRRETSAEDGEAFTDEVRQAIADVTRAGPGLTIGHPDVDLLLDRRRQAREEVVPEAEEAAHRRLSQAVIDDPEANGPNSRAMEELLQRVNDQDAAQALLKAKHRNLVWIVAAVALSATQNVAGNVAANLIASAYGPAITDFVSTNYTLLSEIAATFGRGVLVWFQQTVGPLMAGIDTTVIRPIRKPDWRR